MNGLILKNSSSTKNYTIKSSLLQRKNTIKLSLKKTKNLFVKPGRFFEKPEN